MLLLLLSELLFPSPPQAENEYIEGESEWVPDDEVSVETKLKVCSRILPSCHAMNLSNMPPGAGHQVAGELADWSGLCRYSSRDGEEFQLGDQTPRHHPGA